MQSSITIGHVPAGSASRAQFRAVMRKVSLSTLNLLLRKAVTIAAISAAVTYAGIFLGSDAITFSAAFSALAAVKLANSSRKGGAA